MLGADLGGGEHFSQRHVGEEELRKTAGFSGKVLARSPLRRAKGSLAQSDVQPIPCYLRRRLATVLWA
jgi:hypothetical protein